MSQSAQSQPTPQPQGAPRTARYLLDSNLLLRLSDRSSHQHQTVKQAVGALIQSGAELYITPQNIIEFWSVATRPKSKNGLAFPRATAQKELAVHRATFALLPDRAEIFPQWERLIQAYAVEGVLAHDTRLAAVALVYGVENVLTFNLRDFNRFAREGLNILSPASVPPYSPPTGAATP